jgi:ribosomal protein S13
MARIAGIEIENEKRLWVALLGIYGIGETSAKEMCKKTM